MDPDLVLRKVGRATAWLEDVERRVRVDPATFSADADSSDLAAFHLQLALQECLDLAAHWIASEGWVPAAHAAASFDSLAAHGVIPPDLAAFLRGAASLRNRIAHGYGDVDLGRLQAEARAGSPGCEGAPPPLSSAPR